MIRYNDVRPRQNKNSVFIKDDIEHTDQSFLTNDEPLQLPYNLEVQNPTERKVILHDDDFFKKLSLSFYANSQVHSKSQSPKRPLNLNTSEDSNIFQFNISRNSVLNRVLMDSSNLNETYNFKLPGQGHSSKAFQIRPYSKISKGTGSQNKLLLLNANHLKKVYAPKHSTSPNQRDNYQSSIGQLKMFLGEGPQMPKNVTKKPVTNMNTQEKVSLKYCPSKAQLEPQSSKIKNAVRPSRAANLDNNIMKEFSQASRSPHFKQETQGNEQKSAARLALKGMLELKASPSAYKLLPTKSKQP